MDLSNVPVSVVAAKWATVQKMLKKQDGASLIAPETDALWFYLTHHAMAEINLQFDEFEPLMEYQEFVETYHKIMQVKSLRMFY